MLLVPSYFEIPHATVLQVSGRDALRYLQARLSNDLRSLTQGTALRAAMLTAQGKTEGLFSVIQERPETYLLLGSGADSTQLLNALRRFAVADRVVFFDLSNEWALFHLVADTTAFQRFGLPITDTPVSNNVFLFPMQRTEVSGFDALCPLSLKDSFIERLRSTELSALSPQQQEVSRIRAGIPDFPKELNEHTLFSESGLLTAVSFKKGCYVGQEVIEKVDAVGKLARMLSRFEVRGQLTSTLEPLRISTASGETIGNVNSYAFDSTSGTSVGFATIRNNPSHTRGFGIRVQEFEGVLL